MGLEGSESIRQTTAEAAGAFADSFIDVFKRPIQGAAQLSGSESSVEKQQPHESTAASVGHTAGSILGNAVLFVGMTSALARVPGIGRAASYAVGGALGFLQPTSADQGLGTRFANAALGAGTVGLLDVGPTTLGLAKSSWMPGSQVANLIPESQLGRVAMANAGIGALNTQLDSVIHNGHAAGIGETLLGSALWAGTGAGAHGLGELVRRGDTQSAAPNVVPVERQSTTVRMSEFGENGPFEREVEVPADSPTASIFQAAKNGTVRIETMVAVPEDGIHTQVASGFAVKGPNDQLRVITSNHLMTADHPRGELVDLSVFDSRGNAMKGALVIGSEILDSSVVAVEDGSHLKPLQMSTRSMRSMSDEDENLLIAGYPMGGKDLTLMTAKPVETPRGEDPRIFAPTAQEGNCGSACMSLADGTVAGMYKNETRNTPGVSHVTEAAGIAHLLRSSASEPVKFAGSGPVQSQLTFLISDPAAGRASVRNILDGKFADRGEPDFMHSHVLRVPLTETEHELGLQIQYLPLEQRLSMRPLVLDNRKLDGTQYWPRTSIAMRDAQLNIALQGETPLRMESINDPHNVLARSLDRIDSSGYLANLKPDRDR